MSAKTPALAVTPEPHGRPGGPGLYGVKGNKHSDYFEQVVGALMRRGMSQEKASKIAWHALRSWAAGRPSSNSRRSRRGKIHPEVRAAASAALGEEASASAKAHTNETIGEQLDLAGGVWHGLGRGKGWAYVGPTVQQQLSPAAAKAKASFASYPSIGQQAAQPQAPPTSGNPKNAALAKQLREQAANDRKKAEQIGMQIQALRAAIINTHRASVAAKRAYARGRAAIAGKTRTTRSGGSKASGSSTTGRPYHRGVPAVVENSQRRQKIRELQVERTHLLTQAKELDARANALDPPVTRRGEVR